MQNLENNFIEFKGKNQGHYFLVNPYYNLKPIIIMLNLKDTYITTLTIKNIVKYLGEERK